MEKVHPWCGQPSDRRKAKEQNRTDKLFIAIMLIKDTTLLVVAIHITSLQKRNRLFCWKNSEAVTKRN